MDSSKVNDHDFKSDDLDDQKEKDVKGKSALDILHKNIVRENEKNINLKISNIYGVDYDEASEIHVNYHTLRIKNMIEKNGALVGMKSFIENYFDIKGLSSKVVSGDMTENTCLDIIFSLVKNQKESKIRDRYINFYN